MSASANPSTVCRAVAVGDGFGTIEGCAAPDSFPLRLTGPELGDRFV